MNYFLLILVTFYLIYTLNFAIRFNKANTIFNDNKMLIHNFLIWIIPFFWIMIIKSTMKPTPGSGKFKVKSDAGFDESGIGVWGDDDGHHTTDSGN